MTSLVVDNNLYYLPNSDGTLTPLQFDDGGVWVGQFCPSFTPIGYVQTSSGYEVAWRYGYGDLVAIWACDRTGNVVSYQIYSHGSYALELLETTFGQDLNGDGVIGPTKTVISTDGSTSLTQYADEYFLTNSEGNGPALSDRGSPIVAGQFPGWAPIEAVATASGYLVAWENTESDLYSIWSTDNNGNVISYQWYIGTDPALKSLETTSGLNLNIAPTTTVSSASLSASTTTVISTDGSTSLTQVANEYFLYGSNGTGPALSYQGAPVVDGQFSGWVPIGAVATSSGYLVAWQNSQNDLYSIWNTDSNGNVISYQWYLGTDHALESLETVFGQDLNGDGTIGPTKTVISTDGSTSLTQYADEYFLTNSDGNGPALSYQGAPVVDGQFPGWAPIGAVATASGYLVAWEDSASGLYSIWGTDSNGNVVSYTQYIGNAYGGNYALESLETVFGQDLNRDGVIGPTKTVISTDGSTSLTQYADEYFLTNSEGNGPALSYAGNAVFDSEFAPWEPIGALATSSGYAVTWNYTGTDEYSLWNVDSSGNVTSYIHYQGSATATMDAGGLACLSMLGNLELLTACATDVAFPTEVGTYDTLIIDQATSFTGSIYNFTGTSSASSDAIDLKDIAFQGASVAFSANSRTDTGGTLTVYDANGTTADTIFFATGEFQTGNFDLADDGQGGLLITDPPTPTTLSTATVKTAMADAPHTQNHLDSSSAAPHDAHLYDARSLQQFWAGITTDTHRDAAVDLGHRYDRVTTHTEALLTHGR